MSTALRRVDDARGTVLVVGAAFLLTIVSVVSATNHPWDQRGIAVAFAVFIALGEVVRISLPGAGEAAPIAAAAALAYALLGEFGGTPTTHTVADVVTVTALAGLVGAVPHVVAGRALGLDVLSRRVLAVALAALLFRPLYDGGTGVWARLEQHEPNGKALLAVVMVAIAIVAGVFEACVAALVRADRDRAPYLSVLRSELRALVGLGSAIGATGVLIALAAQVMRLWAIPVFVVPLLLTQFSVRRYAGIKQTYAQTIRSLSRVTEVGGYTETGHSRRVCDLALAVGRELGMSRRRAGRPGVRRPHARPRPALAHRPDPGRRDGDGARGRAAAHRRDGRRGHPADRRAGAGSRPSSSGRPTRTDARTRRSTGRSRWPAASSRRPTPTTTWSATRARACAGSRRSSGCGCRWRTTTTRGWSAASPGWSSASSAWVCDVAGAGRAVGSARAARGPA